MNEINLIVIGNSCIGKSCIIRQYIENRYFEKTSTIIGIDYF